MWDVSGAVNIFVKGEVFGFKSSKAKPCSAIFFVARK